MRRRIAALALLAGACAAPPPLASENARWTTLASVAVDDQGRSAPFTLEVRDGATRLVLRVSPEEGGGPGLCYRLAPLAGEMVGELIGAAETQGRGLICDRCRQRVYASEGRGVFVFPNDGVPLLAPDRLTGAAQLLDCQTGLPASRARFPDMPRSLRVEQATLPVEAAARGRVELVVTALEGSGYEGATDADALLARDDFRSAFAFVEDRFREAGIDLELVRAVPGGVGRLRFGPGRIDALRAVDDALTSELALAPEGFAQLRVALAACLERDDPLEGLRRPVGFATSVPLGGRSPSLVLVSTGGCAEEGGREPLGGAALGRVLAHELGHALGLYHADQPDGAHLPVNLTARLMDRDPLAVEDAFAHFSAAEGRVMRLHPAVLPEAP